MSKAAELAALIGSQTALSDRNMIINGAMQCWQRATAATAAANSYSTVDRFYMNKSNDGAYTTEQSTDTPTGAGFSLKAQVTTADTSISSAQYAYIHQNIEAQNLQRLQYGTSNAKNITLSFQVKSNKTGTYTIVVRKFDTTTYHLVIEYTINSANTWEKKEITISPTAGSTSLITASGGAIANDNGTGFQIGWNLAFGSNFNGATNNTWSSNTSHYATSNQVNWMDSTSNNFYLTQVQLELGEQATPFEHRSFGDELLRCQRYFYSHVSGNEETIANAAAYSSTQVFGTLHFPVSMRITPSLAAANGTNYYRFYRNGSNTDFDEFGFNDRSKNSMTIYKAGLSGLTAGHSGWLVTNNASASLTFDSEL